MQKIIILINFLLIFLKSSFCQNQVSSTKDSIVNNIIKQVLLFPQEKLYLHVDKPVYITGEKIWFRAYLVDAVLHKTIPYQYVNVELINPFDSIVSIVKIKQYNGVYSGFIPIDQHFAEGDYTLCAFSENMLNTGKDYFYKKRIRIVSPLSAAIGTDAKFKFIKSNEVTAELSFTDIVTQQRIRPEGLKISINDRPISIHNVRIYDAAYFSFKLPNKVQNNALFVETNKNRKYIPVQFSDSDFEVTFYPEGGYLLDGVRCKVAFKSLNSNGLPERVTGIIQDVNSNEYAQIVTIHDGMGEFYLTSKYGTDYYAVCKNDIGKERRFNLPVVQKGSYSLKVETVRNKLYVSVLHSMDVIENKELYLIMHTRGIVHYASPWDHNYNSLSFDTEKFPSGVMQIILFDGKMNPISERLVFCLNKDQANIDVRTDLQNYKPREKVIADVKLTDSKGNLCKGTFSVSITDDNDIMPDSEANILSNILLTSELRGYINNASYYFNENNPEVLYSLDLLMLTNGWRRYNIPGVATGRYEKPEIPSKYGMEITGMVRRLILGTPVEKGKVAIFSWQSGYYDETETKSDGRFIFREIEYQDSMKFIIQALNKKGGDRVELFIDVDSFPKVSGIPVDISIESNKREDAVQLTNFITKADKKIMIENATRDINLPEVFVTARAKQREDYNFSFYMPKVSSDVLTSEQFEYFQPTRVSEILYHFPGVRILEDESGRMKAIIERMSLRMTGPSYNFASLIVDDMKISDYDLDNEIDPANIERIGVLRGSQAILLGGEGSGGAIIITTKKGNFVKNYTPKFNIKILNPLGYQKPIEVYSPRYDTKEQKNRWNPDMRTTIYWNPNVFVSATGEASFDFYTADASTTYTMVIEGMTEDGSIIHNIKKISRK
jgi:hypothetical protein